MKNTQATCNNKFIEILLKDFKRETNMATILTSLVKIIQYDFLMHGFVSYFK